MTVTDAANNKHTLPRPWSDRPAAVVESRRSVVASRVILCWEMASRGSRETVASSSQRRPVAAPSHVHWLTETTAFVLQIRLPTTSSWLPFAAAYLYTPIQFIDVLLRFGTVCHHRVAIAPCIQATAEMLRFSRSSDASTTNLCDMTHLLLLFVANLFLSFTDCAAL